MLCGICLVAVPAARAQPAPDALSRIVHRFDFNEPDYYGEVPRGWLRFPDHTTHDPAFPRYADGRFDRAVGHEAPPSFYLDSAGRSVAYHYTGDEARIRPGEYLITGYVRPNALRHARASISAYYLDWEGRFIPGTQRFSALIGSADAADTWHHVEVPLPSAPTSAHFIGITCWVVQDEVWTASIDEHRHVPLRDVHGGAWFDDIVIKGRPRALLSTAHPGNVVASSGPLLIDAVVADDEIEGLTATLVLRNRAGTEVASRSVQVQTFDDPQTRRFRFTGLRPDLYHAELAVHSLGALIVKRDLDIAVVGRQHRPAGQNARRMGVVIGQAPVDGAEDTVALLTELGVGAVKLPIWPSNPAQPAFDVHADGLHGLLDRLIAARVDVIGVLGGAPTHMVANRGAYASTLLDVLSQDPRAWRSDLDAIFAPYASIFNSWQLGADGDPTIASDPRAAPALLALHDAMREMLPSPRLATVTSAGDYPGDTRLPAQNLNISVPADVHAAELAANIAPFRDLAYNHLWLTLPAPEAGTRVPDAALADWTRRLLAARETGVDRIFVPAPWRVRVTEGQPVTEPADAFLVLRTLNDQLADMDYLSAFDTEPGGTIRAFGDGSVATLVAWDPEAPPEGTPVTMQLGHADRVVDFWGRETPLARDAEGLSHLTLTRAPVFIPGVEQWLVTFRAAMQLAPQQVPFAIEPQRHQLLLRNPRDTALSGEIALHMPAPWEIEPARMRFALPAHGSQEIPVLIRQPQDETAGPKTVGAEVRLASDPKYRLAIPLRFELGLPDLDVWGYAVNEGPDLRIRQGITNRSAKTLSFRAFAMVPGRSRQYRTISQLLPGQSLTIEYLFAKPENISGRRIRLGLREVNGPRLHNLEIEAP